MRVGIGIGINTGTTLMLRFATKPDRIFLVLLGEAIAEALGCLELDDDPAEQHDAFGSLMPRSAKLFDGAGAKAQLVTLKTALGKAELYQPTDYHWLLLYEAFEAWCLEFDEASHGLLFTVYGIAHIDFDRLADVFFWDTDFLDEHIPAMSLESRELIDISPETFGLTAGLKPHPEELELELCDEELSKEFDDHLCLMYLPGSKEYPSLPDVHAN